METEKMEVTAGATPMCANGCGFFGSAATKNFCSQCYKKHVMMKTAAVAPVAEKKVDAAPAPADKEKHEEGSSGTAAVAEKKADALPAPAAEKEKCEEGSSGIAAVAEKKVDAAPAPAEKESGSSAETTEKHEAAKPCVNGCSFFGSAATKNMCSSCYKNFLIKNVHAAPAAPEKIEVAPEQPSPPPPQISAATSSAPAPAKKAAASRCAGCNKKVGLLGFVCRCGGTFCSVHRYGDQHACEFDFKTADRERIAKKNPLVVAPKINKI